MIGKFKDENGNIVEKEYKKLLGAYFFLSDKKNVYNRKVEDILEVLSALGGINKAILLVVLSITRYFSDKTLTSL